MTKPDTTLIAFILDRSGSMGDIVNDTIGGFNAFIEKQLKVEDDEARLTLVQFDTEYEVIHSNLPLSEVPLLTTEVYFARGGTALLDAMAKTINDVGASLAAMPEDERPEAVVVVTVTDGEENSSREFSKEKVGEMIKKQEGDYNWQFVFLGANFDAIAAGHGIGIKGAHAMNFKASSNGMDVMYQAVSDNMSSYRSTKVVSDLSFTAAQRDENDNADNLTVTTGTAIVVDDNDKGNITVSSSGTTDSQP